MKCCPNCGANVEGLLYWCDCCLSPLHPKKQFVGCAIYDLPQCLGFASLIREITDAIQPENPDQYSEFLDEYVIGMYCLPKGMLENFKIKEYLSYWPSKKYGSMKIIVDYDEYIHADKKGKARLVADGLLRALCALESRLQKKGLSIDDMLTRAKTVLGEYIN